MTIQTSYTDLRARLASLLDEVTENNEVVIIHRRGAEDVALISAATLRSLRETVYLLRSPRNVDRLFRALACAEAGEGAPETIEELRRETRFADES